MGCTVTPNDVRIRVKEIANLAGDDEAAHSTEDKLYVDVLTAIASGMPQARRMAEMALDARSLKFERWCA